MTFRLLLTFSKYGFHTPKSGEINLCHVTFKHACKLYEPLQSRKNTEVPITKGRYVLKTQVIMSRQSSRRIFNPR